jgi:hypothetical protein
MAARDADLRIMYLVGCAGLAADCQAFAEWAIYEFKGERPHFTELSALVIYKDGRIDNYTEMENVHHLGVLPYWSVGSGADYALGVLAHGGTAEEAVHIASQLDINTGLGIDTVTFS